MQEIVEYIIISVIIINKNKYVRLSIMIGAIIGDIVGSRYERINIKTKEFDLFSPRSRCTDDSIMTLAVADAILKCNNDYSNLSNIAINSMQELGKKYPRAGYGLHFNKWIHSDNPQPYGSYGNGAAMRVSPCGYAAKTIDDAITLSNHVTKVSHNHKEGIKGAEAVSVAVFLARQKNSIDDIKKHIVNNYYNIDFTLDEIRNSYKFDVSCQNSVPQAMQAFFESNSFENAIRNAISIGGDSDTIGAITGSIAGAYYGIPEDITNKALKYLDDYLKEILFKFEETFA